MIRTKSGQILREWMRGVIEGEWNEVTPMQSAIIDEGIEEIEKEAVVIYRKNANVLARAWKRKAKLLRYILKMKYKEEAEWQSALRLAGIGRMSDLNPDAIRLTITVPSQKRVAEMIEEERERISKAVELWPSPWFHRTDVLGIIEDHIIYKEGTK